MFSNILLHKSLHFQRSLTTAQTRRAHTAQQHRYASTTALQATVRFVGAEGQEIAVQCADDEYILDAGLNAGLELPYTCRGGICGACVGRVTSGSVDQSDVEDISFTLEEEEIEKGMTLLCMARPVGDVTVETQSDWGYSLGVAEWKGATGKITGGKVEPLMGKKWDEIKKEVNVPQ